MIGSHAGALVHRKRVTPLEQDILLGAHHEERQAQGEHVESFEIDVAAIHHVEGTGLGQNLVEDVDVVHRAVGNADKRGGICLPGRAAA